VILFLASLPFRSQHSEWSIFIISAGFLAVLHSLIDQWETFPKVTYTRVFDSLCKVFVGVASFLLRQSTRHSYQPRRRNVLFAHWYTNILQVDILRCVEQKSVCYCPVVSKRAPNLSTKSWCIGLLCDHHFWCFEGRTGKAGRSNIVNIALDQCISQAVPCIFVPELVFNFSRSCSLYFPETGLERVHFGWCESLPETL